MAYRRRSSSAGTYSHDQQVDQANRAACNIAKSKRRKSEDHSDSDYAPTKKAKRQQAARESDWARSKEAKNAADQFCPNDTRTADGHQESSPTGVPYTQHRGPVITVPRSKARTSDSRRPKPKKHISAPPGYQMTPPIGSISSMTAGYGVFGTHPSGLPAFGYSPEGVYPNPFIMSEQEQEQHVIRPASLALTNKEYSPYLHP